MFKIIKTSFIFLFFLALASSIQAATSLNVVINEIAWMGTAANSSDEWIELYNNTAQDINLEGWELYEEGGETLIEPLTGIIEAKSYYLIERTDDNTISNIEASQEPTSWGGHGLNNSGEYLQLSDANSQVIDEVNCTEGWFAGEGKPDYRTMERKDTQGSGSDSNNWATNNGEILNGHDAEGKPINGTPRNKNSVAISIVQPQTQATEEKQQETQPITHPSGVLINEILPSPEGPDSEEEWIEIFNQNNFTVSLSDWQIKDKIGKVTIYTFPEKTEISAKSFLVSSRPTTKITLNNDGDEISLLNPEGKIVASVIYEKAPRGQSYNFSEGKWFWGSTITRGSANIVFPSALTEEEVEQLNKEPLKEETKEADLKENVKENLAERELAAIGQQISESSRLSSVLFVAMTLAVLSGAIILILKRKIRKIVENQNLE